MCYILLQKVGTKMYYCRQKVSNFLFIKAYGLNVVGSQARGPIVFAVVIGKARGNVAFPLDNTNSENIRHTVGIRRLNHTQFCFLLHIICFCFINRDSDNVQSQPLAPRCRWQPRNGPGKQRRCPRTSPRSSPHLLSASERWTPWRAWVGTGSPWRPSAWS